LDRVRSRPRPEVVHSRLEPSPPPEEVHRGELAERRVREVDVERLGLVDERSSVSGEVDDLLLRDLPDGLVDRPTRHRPNADKGG
jgi:hypothetical protein